MTGKRQKIPQLEYGTETADELIGLLTAISIVSKRLARNITLLREMNRKRGDPPNARPNPAHAD
jgi:hypothetical protein